MKEILVQTFNQLGAIVYAIVIGYPFIVGFCSAVTIGLLVFIIGNTRRHCCKVEDCGCGTKTYYRMIRLHNIPATKNGQSTWAVFKFRACDRNHVSVSMKTKLFTPGQINAKSSSEFDWKSDLINGLCARAGITNPETDYLLAQCNNPNASPRLVVTIQQPGRYWPKPQTPAPPVKK